MKAKEITLPADQCEASCLELMDEVSRDGVEITITKHGQPVARLVPTISPRLSPNELYGAMADMAIIHGDLAIPLDDAWDADSPLDR